MSGEAIVRIRLPEQLPEPLSHYTDAVRAGDHIWISGMLGVDAAGTLSDAGVASQAEQVFRKRNAFRRRVAATPTALAIKTADTEDDTLWIKPDRRVWAAG